MGARSCCIGTDCRLWGCVDGVLHDRTSVRIIVALLAREAKSSHFAVALMAGYLVVAWLVAFGVYQLAGALLS